MNLLPTSIRRSREGRAGWSARALAALAVAWLSGAQPAPAQLAPFITQEPADRIALTGGTVSFTVGVTGDSPLTYQWYHNFLQLIPEGTNATLVLTNIRPADAGTYDVQITNPFGSANSREAVLVVRTPPTLLLPPASQVVTQGQSVSLSVSVIGDAPLGFQWFLNGTNALPGATNSLLGFANVQSTNTGDYSVLITNVAGSVVSPPATLTVLSPPTFLHPPLTILTAAGSTVVLSADVAGDLPLAFQWVLNGTNVLAQATNATLTLTNVQLNDAGAYSVQVTNGVGSLEGLAATLTVLVAPVIRADPVSLVVTQGRPASFTVDATGSAPLSYRWFFNGAGVLRGTNTTLSFSSAQAADGGTYQVTVSNVLGIATSAPAVLTVRVPPAILQQPFGLTVPPGGTAQFTVLALGDEPLAYQWMFNGSDLPGATNSLLLLTNVAPAAAGTYSARVSNPVGSALSVGALLVIKPPPAIAQQPASLVVTQGNAASFTVVAGGDGPFTYQWFLNADPITNATAATYSIPLALPAHAGAYTVRVSSDAGSTSSVPATLTVRVPPLITRHPANLAVAVGGTATFNVLATGDPPLSYQWYFNLTNRLVGETRDTLILTNVQAGNDGRYSVVVSNDIGSASSANALLQVRVPPSITQNPASLILTQGQTAQFTVQVGGDPPFAYQWFLNDTNPVPGANGPTLTLTNVQPAQAGSYLVRVTNQVGFAASAPANLALLLIPTIVQQPANLVLAPGASGTFAVGVSGDPPFTYQWFFNSTNALFGETNASLVLPQIQPALAGSYSVFIANPYGSALSRSATLTVQFPPTIVEQPASLTVTQGTAASFSAVVSGDNPISYQWFFNGTNLLPAATNRVLNLANVQAEQAGTYTVEVTNFVGSGRSADATLTVLLLPAITQQPASLVVTQGQTARFTLVAASDTPLTYQWRMSSTNLPGETQATLTLSNAHIIASGSYDVIARNSYGAVTSRVATLTVFGVDFGDAPEPAYPTLQASDGARHVVVPGFFLGSTATINFDGQPTNSASGDVNAAGNEEDGVRFLTPLRSGQPATVQVLASTNGLLNAWIDFDQAGGWAQPLEQIFTNRALLSGTNILTFLVPPTALAGQTFGRFRFSSMPVSFLGLAPDGEVEDYALAVAPASDLTVTTAVSANRVPAGNNAVFTISVTNVGPSAASGIRLTNRLSGRSGFVSVTSSQGTCGQANGIVACDLGNLASGARATVTLTARMGQGTNTTVSNVTGNEFDPNSTNSAVLASVTGTTTVPNLANGDAIVLPLDDPGPGSVYPSSIVVSGVTSAVFKVTATLRNINHDYPDDIDIILVGPRGQKVYLMSDCGLDNALVDVTITLDDEAAQALPDSDPPIVNNGTYRPSNYGTLSDDFPPPAPPPPYATNLAVFRNTDPNGVWSLYVIDDQAGNATINSIEGFVADGWTLNLLLGDPMADLTITQSAQPASLLVGGHIVYSMAVTNLGPSSSSTLVQDQLPPGVTVVSATASQGSCVNSAGLITCDLGTLASGARATLSFDVIATLGGTLTNLVTVSGPQLDLNPSNNTARVLTTVTPLVDVELVAASVPPTALVGQPLNLSFTVTNHGPNAASGLFFTNVLPGITTFLSASSSQGACTNQAGTVVCALGGLAAGDGATVLITGRPGLTGLSSNFAAAAAAELDPAPGNNTASSIFNVLPAADLGLTTTPAQATLPLGQQFLSTFTVTNRGPGSAVVAFLDRLPASLNVVSAIASRGICGMVAGGVQCNLGTLGPADSVMVSLATTGTTLGTLTNTATLSSSVDDPTLTDLTVTNVITFLASADLAVTLTDRPDPLWLGDDLTYVVAVTNRGPFATTITTLSNILPAGITVVSSVSSRGTCVRHGTELNCDFGPLAVGAGATVTTVLHPDAFGTLATTASVISDLPDPSQANNFAANTTRVIGVSGIGTSVTPIDIPRVGAANPYPSTIFVTGLTAAVANVRVTLAGLTHSYADDVDVLLVGPNGRAVELMSDAGGEFALNNVTLTFDDGALAVLPDSGPIQNGLYRPSNYELAPDTFPVPAPAGPYDTNLAVFSGIDPNGPWSLYVVDDADKDSGAINGGWSLILSTLDPIADLVLTQTLSANPAAVSSNLTFTYTVTNLGPAIATDTRLTNTLPHGLLGLNVSSTSGNCTLVGNVMTCSFGNLAPGTGLVVRVSGSASATGVDTNTVSVRSPLLDLHPNNNSVTTVMTFENPPIITLQPVSRLVTNGNSVELTTAVLGTEPLAYQWQRNGVNVPGANGPTLFLASATPADAGTYRMLVSNRVGAAISQPAILQVLGPPAVSDIPPLTIDEDTATPVLPFTVIDAESPPETIVVFGDSSDRSLVPPSSFFFTGTGSNRTVRITPLPNAAGEIVIHILARDPDNAVGSNSFVLTIRQINDPPTISPIPDQLTVEDVPVAVAFQAFDPETPPDALIYSVTSSNPTLIAPENVHFLGSGSNRIANITPALNESGTTRLTITVTDGDGVAVSSSFQFQVASENDPPTLEPIADLTIDEDSGTQIVNLAGITSGASNEVQHLAVTARSSNPAIIPNPTVDYQSPAQTGVLRFTPLPNANGTAVLTVTVSDGHPTNNTFSRTFRVNVNPINDPPTVSHLLSQTMDEDVPLSLPVTVGDAESAAADLILTASSSNTNLVPALGLIVRGTGAARTLTIVPVTNQVGALTITLTVTDTNGLSTSDNFALTINPVNDPPTLNALTDLTLREDAPAQTVNLTGIGTGAANEVQTLTVTATSSDPALIANPTVTYTSPAPAGTLNFQPQPNATGTVTLTVTVDDGQPANNRFSRSFQVTLTGTNDAPTISGLGPRATDEDTPISVPFTVSDPESSVVQLNLSASSSNPTLVAATNIVLNGAGTSRTALISPRANQFGTTTITLFASDGQLTGSNSFVLTVAPVNDPPTLNALTNVNLIASVGSISIPLSGITPGPTNETQTLTVTASSSSPSLFINQPSVTYPGTGPTNGTLSFRPVNNGTGTATITVTVNDGGTSNNLFSRSFVLNVRALANTQPTLSTIANQTTPEDTPLGPISFNVRDAETAVGSVTVTAASSNPVLLPDANITITGSTTNRNITLLPATNQVGTTTITLTANDGAFGATNTSFNLTVTPVNDPPTIAPIANVTTLKNVPTAVIPIAIDDVDTPAANLTVSAVSGNQTLLPNANIALGGSGLLRGLVLTPAAEESGTANITVRVSDGVASNSTSFVLTVLASNEPPVLSLIPNVQTTEDTRSAPVPFSFRDIDTPPDSVTFSAVSSNSGLITSAGIVFDGTGTNRTVTLTPLPDQSGSAQITVTAADGGGGSSRAFLFTVTAVNDPPTLAPIGDVLVNQGSGPRTIPLDGITSGAANEFQTLAVSAQTGDPGLLTQLAVQYTSAENTGTLTFLPVPDTNGTATVTVTVNDGDITNHLVTRSFSVIINAAPVISYVPDQVTLEDTPTPSIPFSVDDPDGSAAAVTVTALSSNPDVIPSENIFVQGTGSNRTVTMLPATNASGSALITLRATDTNGASADAVFQLSVVPVVDDVVITVQPSNITTLVGLTVSFQGAATSGLPLFFQWFRDGFAIVGATSDTLVIDNAQLSDTGIYAFVVANFDTYAISRYVTLEVVTQPLEPRILSILRAGPDVRVTFSTTAGSTYHLEYKDHLADPAWQLINTTTGAGTPASITDPAPASATRFYRVRAE
jgi:uncharacterized repeat protein (TIGR01451 family)